MWRGSIKLFPRCTDTALWSCIYLPPHGGRIWYKVVVFKCGMLIWVYISAKEKNSPVPKDHVMWSTIFLSKLFHKPPIDRNMAKVKNTLTLAWKVGSVHSDPTEKSEDVTFWSQAEEGDIGIQSRSCTIFYGYCANRKKTSKSVT